MYYYNYYNYGGENSMNRLEKVDWDTQKKRVTIFINESLFREAKAQGIREGYEFSDLIEMLLEHYLTELAYSDEELKEQEEAREKEWSEKDKKRMADFKKKKATR